MVIHILTWKWQALLLRMILRQEPELQFLGGTTFVIDYASQDKGGHTLKEGLDKMASEGRWQMFL